MINGSNTTLGNKNNQFAERVPTAQATERSSAFLFDNCLTCPGGRNCHKCQAGVYGTVLVPLSLASREITKRKRKSRFYVRCKVGIEVALERSLIVRAFTLTESNRALEYELDYGKAVDKFFNKMRRQYPDLAYYWVEHRQGDLARCNRHVICYGTGFLNVSDLEKEWQKVYASKVTGMEKIWSSKGFAFYLSKYLAKTDNDEFSRARMSESWVFPHWWQFNLDYKKASGNYPTVQDYARLSALPDNERANALSWELLKAEYLKLRASTPVA